MIDDIILKPPEWFILAVKDLLRRDASFKLEDLKKNLTELQLELAWGAAKEELAFEQVVIQNEKNPNSWYIHFFVDAKGKEIVVPLNGWKSYVVEDDGTLKFTYPPGIFHDDREQVIIQFKDLETAMEAKEYFIEHYMK